MRRVSPTAFVRRRVALDELYKIAMAVSRRVSRDEDYRGDLIQEGVLSAVKAQEKTPDLTQAVAATVIFRGMLRRLRTDRLDNRRPDYLGRTIFIADAFNEDNEPADSNRRMEAVEDRIVLDQQLREVFSLATPAEREIIETILAEDCTVADASRKFGLPTTTGWGRLKRLRDRVNSLSRMVTA